MTNDDDDASNDLTTPLTNNDNDNNNNNNNNAVNPLVVVGATLTLILLGLSLILVTMLLPGLLWLLLLQLYQTLHHHGATAPLLPHLIVVGVVLQLIHFHQLWTNPRHLAFYRWLSLPFRRWLLPVVMLVCRLDSLRENEPTLYLPLDDNLNVLHALQGQEKTALLLTFRQSVRRRHKHMEQLYVTHRVQRRSVYSEADLNLSHVVPLMWRHIQRQCQENTAAREKGFAGEFIKRFLVMTVVPDGVLDLYYLPAGEEGAEETAENDSAAPPQSESAPLQNGDTTTTTTTTPPLPTLPACQKPVAVQMSIVQGPCLHWFMYFSKEQRAGIWFQGILLSMTRGVLLGPDIRYVNGQTHHETSKQHAGFLVANPQHGGAAHLLQQLYPSNVSTSIMPLDIVQASQFDD